MIAEQHDLFLAPPVDLNRLRYYQEEAVQAVFDAWEEDNRTMLVMATGMGKTQIFAEVASRFQGRVLVLAHRDELIQQAVTRLEGIVGEPIGLEQAQFRSGRERVVVGSVQTVYREDRIERLQRLGGFDLIVADECHHYVARTYRKAIDAWEGAKVLGVTATPDRGDGLALGQIFDSVAYELDISDGIDMGYLVPVEGRRVELTEIDLSNVPSTAGDLAKGHLDDAMLKAVEGIVSETLSRWPDRCGPAFFPGKKSAEYAAERFNAKRPGSAALLTDDVPKDERREIIRACKRGDIQYLCNCMIATEGFDWPDANLMLGGRPTKSRALFAQMVGRVTRVEPGCVDHLLGKDASEARRQAVAASSKPRSIVADFVGNAGKHSLASVEDALGGRYSEEEVERAKKIAEDSEGGDPRAHLEEARRVLRAIAANARSKVSSKVTVFDMFSDIADDGRDMRYGAKPPSVKQLDALARFGVPEEDLKDLSKNKASALMGKLIGRRQQGFASFKQARLLRKHGITAMNVTFQNAKRAIDYLAQNKWGRGPEFSPETLHEIASGRA